MARSPKVFISYAWEGQSHHDRVLALADWLESKGLELIFDQYDSNPLVPWPKWMAQAVDGADFILSICSKAYYDRVTEEQPAGEGLGAQWEGSLIYNVLSADPVRRNKFVVIQFSQLDLDTIPLGL